MVIDIHRIRSFVASAGSNHRQRAAKLGINWHTVEKILDPEGRPKLETLSRLQASIPSDFVAAPLPKAAE